MAMGYIWNIWVCRGNGEENESISGLGLGGYYLGNGRRIDNYMENEVHRDTVGFGVYGLGMGFRLGFHVWGSGCWV